MKMQTVGKFAWGKYAGPSENVRSAIHNWFVYHHSFGKTLVYKILKELKLDNKVRVLDPFCGCGTTLLVCQEEGIESVGMDLMPLSTLVSRAKTHHYNVLNLRSTLKKIESSLARVNSYSKPDISIINKAFTQKAWDHIQSAREVIQSWSSGSARDFFLTALLAVVPNFGAYSNDGGFPRLAEEPKLSIKDFKLTFLHKVKRMMREVESYCHFNGRIPRIIKRDVRGPLEIMGKFDATICSPPYPNRHDYTRVYAVELGTAFLKSNDELKELRRHLFRSHIEAKPSDEIGIIDEVQTFQEMLKRISKTPKSDKRVPPMLRAYFQDMEKILRSIWEVLKPNGVAAVVVGNVRFSGVMIPVDEITALMGKKVGFPSQEIWVIRYRGNSPQQMRDFGRIASRESIIILGKGAQ